MDTLNRHRMNLFNAFSLEFADLKKDLEKELKERAQKEGEEKKALEERIQGLEQKLLERNTPLSTPGRPPAKETNIPQTMAGTVDKGTETEAVAEAPADFSISDFEDKIKTLNETIQSLQTELRKTKEENKILIRQNRKPLTFNAEAQTDDLDEPSAPPDIGTIELQLTKSKATDYRSRYHGLLEAHSLLQARYEKNKTVWRHWTQRDTDQRNYILKLRDEIKALRAQRGLPVVSDEFPDTDQEREPPQISPSKPPLERRLPGNSPPPAMGAIQSNPAMQLTPRRIKAEPVSSPRMFAGTSEIANSDTESDLTDDPEDVPPAPPAPLTRNSTLPTVARPIPTLRKSQSEIPASTTDPITIKSEPSTQPGLRTNSSVQDYSELDLDDIGAKAPTPKIQRTVDPEEARASAEELAEDICREDISREEAAEGGACGGEEEEELRQEERIYRRLNFTPEVAHTPARPNLSTHQAYKEEEEDNIQRQIYRYLNPPAPAGLTPARPTRLNSAAPAPSGTPARPISRKLLEPETPVYIKQEKSIPYSAPSMRRRPMDLMDPNTASTPLNRQRAYAATEPRKAPARPVKEITTTKASKPKRKTTKRITNHTLQEFGEGGEDEDDSFHSPRKAPQGKSIQTDLRSMLETPPPKRPDLRMVGRAKRPAEREISPPPVGRMKKRRSDGNEGPRECLSPERNPPPAPSRGGGKKKSEGNMRDPSPSRFRLNPELNGGVDFAYKETVRGHARRCLPSCTKPCCRSIGAFAAAAGVPLPKKSGPRFRSSSLGLDEEEEAAAELEEEARQKRFLDAYGKHREVGMPRASPPGFWRSEFPGTQELREDREVAEMERQVRGRRMLDEARKGGYYQLKE